MKKVVLGKGLEALIPGEPKTPGTDTKTLKVPLDRITPNPMQPRRDFDEAGLEELARSFRRNGVIQPLLVKEDGPTFTIIAGERRFRAARLAGLKVVPVVVMDDIDEPRMLELALTENLQREDLNAIEVARAYRLLMDRCGYTQQKLSEGIGKSRAAVANVLRLLSLPEPIKEMIRSGRIREGHARSMLSLADEREMIALAERIQRESLSVRAVERTIGKARRRRPARRRLDPALADVESSLKQLLGTSVRIVPGRKKGRVEIEYYGTDDLNRLLDLFRQLEQVVSP